MNWDCPALLYLMASSYVLSNQLHFWKSQSHYNLSQGFVELYPPHHHLGRVRKLRHRTFNCLIFFVKWASNTYQRTPLRSSRCRFRVLKHYQKDWGEDRLCGAVRFFVQLDLVGIPWSMGSSWYSSDHLMEDRRSHNTKNCLHLF